MGVIASLLVNLKAQTADFDSKLKKSAGGLRDFESSAKAVSSGITSAFGKIAAVVGGVSLFNSAIEAADKYGQFAEVLGDSAENMQALAYAANQNDSSFEALSSSMVRMAKNVVEADQGNKSLAESFSALGLNTSKLMQMNPTEQFKTIADALRNVDNASVRTNLGMSIFGKSFAEIGVLINAGSDAIDAASEKMKAFGLSNEQVAQIKEMKDRLEGLQMQAQAMAGKLVAAFGDDLVSGIEKVSNTIVNGIAAWKSIDSTTREWIKTAAVAASVTWALQKAMVFSAISKTVDIVLSVVKGIKALTTAIRSATVAAEAAQAIATGGASLAKTALGIAAAAGATAMVLGSFAAAEAAVSSATNSLDKNADGLRTNATAQVDASHAVSTHTDELKAQAKVLKEIDEIVQGYGTKVSDSLDKLLGKSDVDIQLNKDVEKIRQAMLDLTEPLVGHSDEWNRLNGLITDTIQTASTYKNLLRNTKFADLMQDAQDETTKLAKGETELKVIEAQRLGLNAEQLLEYRQILEYNERLRKSQEAQKKLAEDQKKAAEDNAKFQQELADKAREKRNKDLDTIQKMEEEASPELKFQVDKYELDRLKEELGMSDKAYNFQLDKLKDDLKKNLGMDVPKDGREKYKQGSTDSVRGGMLQFAMMGGNSDDEKTDRKAMKEYLRILAAEVQKNKGRLPLK